jgi:peptide/nickel transport system substrate-binding protein
VVTLDAAADPPIMLVPAGGGDPVAYTGGDFEMDQLAVTFTMKPDLVWSDGTPLKASDSVYAFNLAADPDASTVKFTIDRTASYEATDDRTIVWTGLPGFKDQTYMINFWGPMPEHVWGQYTVAELKEQEVSARTPLGYGPYVIDEWVQGDSMTLHKNPNYYRASEGLPKFDNLIVRFVGEGSNANIARVLSGECDLVEQTSGLDDQSELLLGCRAPGRSTPLSSPALSGSTSTSASRTSPTTTASRWAAIARTSSATCAPARPSPCAWTANLWSTRSCSGSRS